LDEIHGNLAGFRRSPRLDEAGFRHAFFTRRGGVSEGPYASLNFSSARGDDPERVRENLSRAAAVLAVPPSAVYFLSQVHGVDSVVLEGTEDRGDVLYREGDAVVSVRPGVACGVRTADCVPILVADRDSGAVAAIHAGWRGAVAGVVPNTLATLRSLTGTRGRLVAAIGPHIGVEAFEVGEEVADAVRRVCPDVGVVDRSFGTRPHVDLCRLVRHQLTASGLTDADIDVVPGCTATDADLFSYRRDGPRSGRLLSAIVAGRSA
jgi:polyphenol oxidase